MSKIAQASKVLKRCASTSPATSKTAGDISSVFPSLSGKPVEPLHQRFQALKRSLVKGKEEKLQASWSRLISSLQEEISKIKAHGSDVSSRSGRRNICTLLTSF